MKDLPIIYLLLNTTLGKIIIGIFVVYLVVSIAGWWLVPIIASLIGCVMIYDYYEKLRNDEKLQEMKRNKKNKPIENKRSKAGLITGICFLAFAVLFILFYVFYMYRNRNFPREPRYYPSINTQEEMKVEKDTDTWVPDTVIMPEEKSKPVRSSSVSYHSSSSRSSSKDDNMRGWDPASEDDMEDNGMSRYMENNDEEGWD